MPVTIVTDSGNDLTQQEAAKYGIEIVPVYIVFGEQRLRDGIDIDRATFERRMAAGEKPRTEPASVDDFRAAFERLTAGGNEVVCITLSSQISKSFENASAAAAAFGSKVNVVDSRGGSGLELLFSIYAAERVKAGDSASEIASKLDSKALKAAAYFAVPDLTGLGNSGRLPKPVVALGSMLNVSLVLRMNEQGAITPAGQSRSYDKTCELMIDALLRAIEHSPSAWVAISHGNDPEVARQLASQLEEKLGHPPRKQFLANTPLTILSNLGSKGVGIFAIVP